MFVCKLLFKPKPTLCIFLCNMPPSDEPSDVPNVAADAAQDAAQDVPPAAVPDVAPDAAPAASKPWKPSGALSNPDPTIADMSTEEYTALTGKSDFFRPAAKVPKMAGGHQCSLMEAGQPEEIPDGTFHQEAPTKKPQVLPMLSVSGCMFICKCRCVCVVDCACMINNVVLVPLPG